MSRVDYYAIKDEIKTIVEASTYITTSPRVIIEDDVMFGAFDNQDHVMIYLTSRAPSQNQPIAAGRITRYQLSFNLWVWSAGINVREAEQKRDDLLSNLELTLINNRTLNDKVGMLWLQGGDMTSIRPDKIRFLSGAELNFVAEVDAVL